MPADLPPQAADERREKLVAAIAAALGLNIQPNRYTLADEILAIESRQQAETARLAEDLDTVAANARAAVLNAADEPRPCAICKLDNCVKPGHRLQEVYGQGTRDAAAEAVSDFIEYLGSAPQDEETQHAWDNGMCYSWVSLHFDRWLATRGAPSQEEG